MAPLRWVEAALVAALLLAMVFRSVDAAWAAIAGIGVLNLMRSM
jgi:hypothetical protein